MQIIKRLQENKKVFFDVGTFDKYCVYISDDYGKRAALKDGEYFKYFNDIKNEYPENKIFDDFMLIYNATSEKVTQQARDIIDEIVKSYKPEHQVDVEKYFTIIYGGMVAELNKQFTMLGKQIKLLGFYQVIKENMDPEEAANFSRNKPWKDLVKELQKRNL